MSPQFRSPNSPRVLHPREVSMFSPRRIAGGLATALAVAALATLFARPAQPSGGEFTESLSLEGRRLRIHNLIGEFTVGPTEGSRFEVEIRVQGKDATRERIRLETKRGEGSEVSILFPLEESTRYVYPRLGTGSRSTFMANRRKSGEQDSWWKALVGTLKVSKIEVSGDGKGLEIWADVTVKVPRGGILEVDHGVGGIDAAGVEGELRLDNATGNITAQDIHGRLSADTGSGNIRASGITGGFDADTGSGDVTVQDIRGDVHADTGSGDVSITDAQGDEILADTGSGEVTVLGARCKLLAVDTGSGDVEARNISAEEANLDTGSGKVQLRLLHMGPGPFVIDTGSGDIDLVMPADGSAQVRAETGSGAIHVDFENEKVHRVARDEISFTVGEGTSSVRLEAGSGTIRISG